MERENRGPAQSDAPEDMRWCAGLPGAGESRVTDAQHALALRVYHKARDAAFLYALLGATLLPASIGLGYLLGRVFGGESFVPLAAAMVLFFFGIPLAVAKSIDQAKTALPLRRDLTRGVLWIFEGSIAAASYEEEDPDVVALVEEGTLVRGQAAQRIGVLPSSSRLLQINGKDVEPKRKVHVATTAASPERSLRYSLPPDVKQAFGTTVGLKRRRFGEAERKELTSHIARLTAVPFPLFVLTAFMAVTVSLWAVKGMETGRELLGLGWVIAWLLTALRHVRRYLLARRLEDDLQVGWLISWETPEAPRTPSTPPFSTAEVLPISQMDWMIDGKPAAWRRVIQRARAT